MKTPLKGFASSNFLQSTAFSTISIERVVLVYMNFKMGQVNLGRQRLQVLKLPLTYFSFKFGLVLRKTSCCCILFSEN